MCVHRGASVRPERHTLSFGQNKHGHNNSALYVTLPFEFKGTVSRDFLPQTTPPGPIRHVLGPFRFYLPIG